MSFARLVTAAAFPRCTAKICIRIRPCLLSFPPQASNWLRRFGQSASCVFAEPAADGTCKIAFRRSDSSEQIDRAWASTSTCLLAENAAHKLPLRFGRATASSRLGWCGRDSSLARQERLEPFPVRSKWKRPNIGSAQNWLVSFSIRIFPLRGRTGRRTPADRCSI